ncbi:MAG: hypothetical protein IJM56_05425 [Clostridia bacterium]|nr:hypothetical protein [Clostridia bacterium]
MSKKPSYEKERRAYVRQQLKRHPPFGSELVLYGAIIILMWALGELNASYTFIKAWFKVDKKILETYNIPLRSYIKDILLTTPEAVDAIKQLAVLILGIVSGIVGIVLRRRKISVLMMITAVIVAFYEVPKPFWMSLTSYTHYIKLAGCALLFTGGTCKIATWAVKRRTAGEQFDRQHKKLHKMLKDGRSDKTLIPARIAGDRK